MQPHITHTSTEQPAHKSKALNYSKPRLMPMFERCVRVILAFTQVLGVLGVGVLGVTQPDLSALAPLLPEAIAAPANALAEQANVLLGQPKRAMASVGQPDPDVLGASSITVTKRVIGSLQSNFTVNIVGPSYPSGASVPIISGSQAITGLVNGVYTITETSPGAGWVTIYTVNGASNSANAIVTLTNASTVAPFAATQITGRVFHDFNSDGLIATTGLVSDTGVQTVTVTAYDSTGAAVGNTTTDTVTTSAATIITGLTPGIYTVTESSLPNAPVGYVWAWTSYAPYGTVTTNGNATTTVTVTNYLAPTPSIVTGSLLITKTVIGSSQSNYSVTVTGPSYPSGQVVGIVSGTNTIANLIPGVYTITEVSPGASWITTYTVGAVTNEVSAVALPSVNGVRIKWVTTSEIDTWSFTLYRAEGVHTSDVVADEAEKITPEAVLGEGRGGAGAMYEFNDTEAGAGKVYTYWLVETETTGRTNVYGPAKWGAVTSANNSASGATKVFLPMLLKAVRH